MQLRNVLALAAAVFAGCASALDFSDTALDGSGGAAPVLPVSENEEERIYGGSEADAEKYPFTVSLRKTAEGSTYCGGALVAPQYVVTAAHCVKNVTYASIGSRYSSGSKEGERLLVTEVFVHPKYTKATHVYDVAVMKLEKPSTYQTLPLCKPDGSQNKENTMAVVRGWGMTESNVAATTMLQVNVKIISNAVCNKSYNNRITAEMICAGQGGGKDTCQGDSGGPLIANNVLVGIVSWGGACGEAPGVYTRATSVLDFINEKIGGGSATSTTAPATTAPAATAAPEATPATTAPAATTAAPVPTTAAPVPTTAAPVPKTTSPSAPALTPATPATSAPALTPATPATTAPVVTPSPTDPASDAATPTKVPDTPSKPSKPSKPSTPSKPSKPTKKPKKDCGVRL